LQCAKQYVFSKPHQAYTITRAFEELEDIQLTMYFLSLIRLTLLILFASASLHHHSSFYTLEDIQSK